MKGAFITLEGVEGCGKTTQMSMLRDRLEADGHRVLLTREPGGTPIAEAVRDILLDPANTALSPVAELLLYEAARAQHVAERIKPALDNGIIVICDRFADSTTAYQGAGRVLPLDTVLALHRVATGTVWPDLTIVLDIPAEAGLKRAAAAGLFSKRAAAGIAIDLRKNQPAHRNHVHKTFRDVQSLLPDH